jgi:HlyD family secretion protein
MEGQVMKSKKIKSVIIVTVVIALVTGGFLGYKALNPTKTTAKETFMPVKVSAQTISQSISASGTVSNAAQTDVLAENNGTLATLNVKEGDIVKAGDTIATINDTSSQQAVSEASAALYNQNLALAKANKGTAALYTKAPAAGRVKSIGVSVGDDLSNLKSLNSLMTISTDGKMKASVTGNASPNEAVFVKINGTFVAGTVTSTSAGGSQQSQQSGNITVEISGDTFAVGTEVTVYKADKSTIIGTGSLSINSPVTVQGPGNGVISNVYVSENTVVNKGDNLFKLNGDDVNNSITSQNLAVQQAQTDLSNKQAALAKTKITSPIDGIIVTTYFKAGDTVAMGKPVVTVIDPTQMQTVVAVDELDIAKVKVGQAAKVTLDAFPNKTYDGTVTKIANIGTVSNGVTTYGTTVSISSTDPIKVGMTSNVQIIINSKDNVLVVPTNAVQSSRGSKYVILSKGLVDPNARTSYNRNFGNGAKSSTSTTNPLKGKTQAQIDQIVKANTVTVTTGISNQTSVEIVSGLNDGDTIVIPIKPVAAKSTSTTKSTTGATGISGFSSGTGGYGGGASGFTRNSGN